MPEIRSPCEGNLIFHSRSLGPVFNVLLRSLASLVLSCALATTVFAQSPAAGSNWEHLKALPPNTRVHVSGDKMGHTCKLISVGDAELVCGKYTFPRAEVKQVKLTRYGTSYIGGAAIGAGAGAGVFLGVNHANKGSFLSVSQGQAAGAGLVVGAVIGTLVTGPADLFKGPTVYRRQ
jgi:hypothetical protein